MFLEEQKKKKIVDRAYNIFLNCFLDENLVCFNEYRVFYVICMSLNLEKNRVSLDSALKYQLFIANET